MKKTQLLSLIFTLTMLLTTACSSSKVKAPIKVEDPVNTNQESTNATGSTASETTDKSTISAQSSETEESSETAKSSAAPESQEVNIVPDFSLKKLDGSAAQLYDFKDKIIVINFWATWCHYCEEEMPLIEALSQNDKYKVIALDVGEDPETIKKYLDAQGLSLDVYLDEDQAIASQFSVTGFPTSVFLGPDFEYLYAYPGMLDQASLDSILNSIDEYLNK